MLDYSKRKCYGFVKNNNGEFIINEIEAQNVKLIFECFLNGMSLSEISKELHSREISSPSGKESWSRKVLSNTLSNEKYHLYGIINYSDFVLVQQEKINRSHINHRIIEDIARSAETLFHPKAIKKNQSDYYNKFTLYYLINRFEFFFLSIYNEILRIKIKHKYIEGT